MEPGTGDESEDKDRIEESHPYPCFQVPVRIRVTSYRRKLADAGQLCDKWLIDALVCAGFLRDDNRQWVKEVSEIQIQSKIERVVVDIESVDNC